jgi:hypothetical protein
MKRLDESAARTFVMLPRARDVEASAEEASADANALARYKNTEHTGGTKMNSDIRTHLRRAAPINTRAAWHPVLRPINHMKIFMALTLFAVATAGCSGGEPSASQAETSTTNAMATNTPNNQPIIENEDLTPGLMGIDSNSNGIRDDIDRLIAKKYSGTPEIKNAVEQHARALQKFLEVTDKGQARLAGQQLGRSIACTYKVFPDSNLQESEFRDRSLKEVEALTSNTKERFAKYWKSNGLVGGMAFSQPKEPVCD